MTSLQSRHTGFWLHLAAWSVVFGLPLFVPGGREPVMNMQEYVRFLVVPLSFMAVFYVNYLLLIDRYLFTRHVGRFLLANALLVAGVMLLVHLFFRFGIPPRPHHPPMERPWQDTMFFFLRNAMLYLLVVGVSVAIRMTGQWYRAENIRKDLERSRSEAELQNLKSQLNPHFLFNTLNTIASFTRTDPLRARELLREFSSFYRATLDNSGSLIPVSREVAQTKRYLTFEKARFGEDRVLATFDVSEDVEDTLVPAFVIQPIVENAVRHGMGDDDALRIDVTIHQDGEDAILIAVADNGVGMDEGTAARLFDERSARPDASSPQGGGAGVAMHNISERIHRFYGPHSYTRVESAPGKGTKVLLHLDLSESIFDIQE